MPKYVTCSFAVARQLIANGHVFPAADVFPAEALKLRTIQLEPTITNVVPVHPWAEVL